MSIIHSQSNAMQKAAPRPSGAVYAYRAVPASDGPLAVTLHAQVKELRETLRDYSSILEITNMLQEDANEAGKSHVSARYALNRLRKSGDYREKLNCIGIKVGDFGSGQSAERSARGALKALATFVRDCDDRLAKAEAMLKAPTGSIASRQVEAVYFNKAVIPDFVYAASDYAALVDRADALGACFHEGFDGAADEGAIAMQVLDELFEDDAYASLLREFGVERPSSMDHAARALADLESVRAYAKAENQRADAYFANPEHAVLKGRHDAGNVSNDHAPENIALSREAITQLHAKLTNALNYAEGLYGGDNEYASAFRMVKFEEFVKSDGESLRALKVSTTDPAAALAQLATYLSHPLDS